MSNRFFIIGANISMFLAMAGCEKQPASKLENPGGTSLVVVSNPLNMAESNHTHSPQSSPPLAWAITEKEAVELAKKTVAGAIQIRPDTKVSVETTNEQIVVTFGGPPPAGVRGADYDAKVIINPSSGRVEKWLVGP